VDDARIVVPGKDAGVGAVLRTARPRGRRQARRDARQAPATDTLARVTAANLQDELAQVLSTDELIDGS
jgi:hypothetical protein